MAVDYQKQRDRIMKMISGFNEITNTEANQWGTQMKTLIDSMKKRPDGYQMNDNDKQDFKELVDYFVDKKWIPNDTSWLETSPGLLDRWKKLGDTINDKWGRNPTSDEVNTWIMGDYNKNAKRASDRLTLTTFDKKLNEYVSQNDPTATSPTVNGTDQSIIESGTEQAGDMGEGSLTQPGESVGESVIGEGGMVDSGGDTGINTGADNTTPVQEEEQNDIGLTNPETTSLIPQDIQDHPDFQALPEDMQALMELFWAGMNASDAESQELAFEAIGQAQELVDPYYQVQIAFEVDEIRDQFAYVQRSTSAQIAGASAQLGAIATLKKNATLEEQQQLASLEREYDQKLTTLQEQVAEQGMTYSSKRSDLETYIGLQNKDMVSSTKRNKENTIANLNARAGSASGQIGQVSAYAELQRQNLARQAEQLLGTELYNQQGGLGLGVDSIGGNDGTPNYRGRLQTQRDSAILDLAGQIRDYGAPQDLDQLFSLNS